MTLNFRGVAVLAAALCCASPSVADDLSDPVVLGIMQGYPLPADKQVSLLNWLKFPENRWAFRNMRTLFPTGEIARGATAVSALHNGPKLDVAALVFEDADGRIVRIAEHFRREYVDGFIVLHRGKIVFQQYFSSMRPEQRHLWQSMTKSVTGLLAEMLAHRGVIDLRKTAGDYVPEIAGSVWGKASLRHLLDMEVNVEEPSTRAANLPADFWRSAHFLDSLNDGGAKQAGANGEVWYYTNNAPQTIGLVLSKVTGKAWHELAQELIWSKLGAEESADIWLDTQGQAAAAGGLSSTLRDAARFAQMIASDGRFNGRQIVPVEVIRTLRANSGNADRTAKGNVAMLTQRAGMSYRSYWYQVNDGSRAIEALGIFGQHIHANPAEQLVIVQLGSFSSPGPDARNWTSIVQAIRKALPRS